MGGVLLAVVDALRFDVSVSPALSFLFLGAHALWGGV